MNYKKVTALLLASLLAVNLSACGQAAATGADSDTTSTSAGSDTILTDNPDEIADLVDTSELFTDRDLSGEYDSSAISIALSDDGSTCDSANVSISQNTITISEEGTYLLSGTLSEGQIIIDAKGQKVQLVLDGVSITNSSSAALYVKKADKVFVTTTDQSSNLLATSGEFTAIDDNNIDAAVFSKSDLTFNGTGSLTVNCTYGHGVVSKDDLRVTGGTYTISAASHALNGKDSVRILDGSFTLTSGKDGIHSENSDDTEKGFIYIADGSFTINSTGDGIDASSVVQIDGGTFDITSGGGTANAASRTGNDDWMTMGKGQMGGGQMGGGFDPGSGSFGDSTEMPEMPSGEDSTEMPEMPSGDGNAQMPEMPSGDGSTEIPEMPSGDGNAQMPEMPSGGDFNAQMPENASTDSTGSAGSTDTAASGTDSSTSCKGIKSDGAMKLSSLALTANTADDSVHAGGAIYVMSGTYTLATGDDGVHSDSDLIIYDGVFDISESYEGLEGMTITIYDGDITLVASDDGLNAAGGNDSSGFGGFGFGGGSMDYSAENQIVINGGTLSVTASGDGIDSNGDFTMNGGTVMVDGPTNDADAPLDWGGSGIVNGGTLIAVGSSGMAEGFSSDSTQGVMLVTLSSSQTGDIELTDADGNSLLTYTAAKSFNCVILSSSDIQSGSTYSLTAGTETTSIEMDSLVYGSGTGMDQGNHFGGGGKGGFGGGKNR
jgi:hypothetical protein